MTSLSTSKKKKQSVHQDININFFKCRICCGELNECVYTFSLTVPLCESGTLDPDRPFVLNLTQARD